MLSKSEIARRLNVGRSSVRSILTPPKQESICLRYDAGLPKAHLPSRNQVLSATGVRPQPTK